MAEHPQALFRSVGDHETAAANRAWWDAQAEDYYAEHGGFLGDDDFVWGPEGWSEQHLGLLGSLRGRDLLEIGGGAGQCGRWCRTQGARVVTSDLSAGMLRRGRRIDRERGWQPLPTLQCDALALPFADASFDVVATAYGAVPFVADSARLVSEAARVLRPEGRLAFATTHPFRWVFPDDPGPDGLTARFSYFDRTPYVEQDAHGRTTYAEHHRTIGDRVREVVAAGLHLVDLVELEWPEGHEQEWGGWSPLRGRLVPGTLVVVADKP